MSHTIAIEVAYALPTKQRIVKLDVPAGTTALDAVKQSQLDTVFEDLEISDDIKLGVWGKLVFSPVGSGWKFTGRFSLIPRKCAKHVRRARRPRARVEIRLPSPLRQIEVRPSWGHPGPRLRLIRHHRTKA